jgi:hypothetical protein
MSNHFHAIDNSSILYQNGDDLLHPSMLTPFSEQKFDLLGSKTDDISFHYDNSLGIYDQYNDSGPSSVQFGDGIDASDHILDGNVRPGDLSAVPAVTGEQLPPSPGALRVDGIQTASYQPGSMSAVAALSNGALVPTSTHVKGLSLPIDSTIVRG